MLTLSKSEVLLPNNGTKITLVPFCKRKNCSRLFGVLSSWVRDNKELTSCSQTTKKLRTPLFP